MKEIKPYEHRVQYYETDQMGIVHHSRRKAPFSEAFLPPDSQAF